MVSGETEKKPAIKEQDVLALTPKGSAELHGARTSLSAQELEVLVLIDGRSTAAQIISSARNKAREAALETGDALTDAGQAHSAGEATYAPSGTRGICCFS